MTARMRYAKLTPRAHSIRSEPAERSTEDASRVVALEAYKRAMHTGRGRGSCRPSVLFLAGQEELRGAEAVHGAAPKVRRCRTILSLAERHGSMPSTIRVSAINVRSSSASFLSVHCIVIVHRAMRRLCSRMAMMDPRGPPETGRPRLRRNAERDGPRETVRDFRPSL